MTFLKTILLAMATAMVVRAGGEHEGGCCKFSLSSPNLPGCPAGQLPDGQIRLNGSYPASTFCIDGGKIKDQNGYGCIVTGPPTTQVQCDENTEPEPSFSIDSSGMLMYKGSSAFHACPATDTEYNVYVKPDFGQPKCIPITLQASGCGAKTSSSCADASTVTVTVTQPQTVLSTIVQNVTRTITDVHTVCTCV
jgi:hypothetical protein